MAAVEPGGLDGGDEELRSVCVGSRVGHGEVAGAGVLDGEALVGELLAVDGLAAAAVTVGEVAALEHELGNDAVEDGPFVVEGFAACAHAFFARAQRAEVLHGLGHGGAVEAHGDPPRGLAADGDVEEDLFAR